MALEPLPTDEPVDRLFSRPVASVLLRVVVRTPLTPNQVTCLAGLTGLAAGVALCFGRGILGAVGIAAFLALDCLDGQLARARGGGDYFGRAFDGVGDYVAGIGSHLGAVVWLIRSGMDPFLALGLFAATFASVAWRSFLFDRYKRRYRGDMDDLEAMAREAEAASGFRRRLIRSLIPYSKRLDAGVQVPDLERYQARVRLPMRLWLLVGPTMNFGVFAVCVALDRPALSFWIAIVPLNLLTLLTLGLQRRAEGREPPVVKRATATAP